MEETKAPTITVNGKEFEVDSLTDDMKVVVRHIIDLDNEIAKKMYEADTAKVARVGFMNILTAELFKDEEATPAE